MSDPRIFLEPEMTYHLYTHASGSENLFRSDDNYRYFLWKYFQYIDPIAETGAYCLMPNHLHLLIRFKTEVEIRAHFLAPSSELVTSPTLQGRPTLEGTDSLQGWETKINFPKALSQRFSNLFNGYTQSYNRKYERKGNLFIPRFKRKLVDNDAYFADLVNYIHYNPVHHGFVSHPADWEFSSWQHSKKQQNADSAFDMRIYSF